MQTNLAFGLLGWVGHAASRTIARRAAPGASSWKLTLTVLQPRIMCKGGFSRL